MKIASLRIHTFTHIVNMHIASSVLAYSENNSRPESRVFHEDTVTPDSRREFAIDPDDY